ncbi:MAG TPA: MFS transporter [Candidatus Angelobacter sp.]|nr:MFS transporter [Candidatus Angelobacter sp.]
MSTGSSSRAPAPAPLWPAYLATFTFWVGGWAAFIAMPLHVVELGGTATEAGLLAAIRASLQAFLQLPVGAITDAWGTRRVLLVATVANALVNLIPLLAVAGETTVPYYAWALASGAASAFFLPAAGAYIAQSAAPEARGSAFGWLTLFTHTGVALGPAIGGLVWDWGGPAPTFMVAAGIGLVAVVASLFLPAVGRNRVRFARLPAMIGEVARQRVIVGTWLAALAIGIPWGAVSGLFPLFGTGIGLGAGTVGLILASQSLANGVSRVPLGRLIDRRHVPPVAAAAGAAGYGVMVMLIGLQTSVAALVAIMVVSVLMLAFTLMLVQVTISEVARPQLRGTGLGGYGTSLSSGLAVGPILTGGVADAAGFGWGFGIIGLVGVVVAGGAALVLHGTRRRPSVEVVDTGRIRPER